MQMPSIIYEDDILLAINKPAGMIVNKADTTKPGETVQEWVENRYQESIKSHDSKFQTHAMLLNPDLNNIKTDNYNIEAEFSSRGGIVHRLDKETSGVLLVAKNPDAFGKLKQQFMDRIVEKMYIALAHGEVIPLEGEISVPVGRLEYNRKRFGVVAGGRDAETHYRVISNFCHSGEHSDATTTGKEVFSLLELLPKTGRTHQIRVHLRHIGHPIFGDDLYAGRKTSRNDRKFLPRIFLHASKISFIHPATGKKVYFETQLPQELKNLINRLEITQFTAPLPAR